MKQEFNCEAALSSVKQLYVSLEERSYIDGGASAAINLRDPTGASIVFISPPSEEKRKKQGPNEFRHMVEPSIDPKNYEPPTVAAIMGMQAKADNPTD